MVVSSGQGCRWQVVHAGIIPPSPLVPAAAGGLQTLVQAALPSVLSTACPSLEVTDSSCSNVSTAKVQPTSTSCWASCERLWSSQPQQVWLDS